MNAIVRMRSEAPRTILVATDFSETAEKAVDYAAQLATKLGAKLAVVTAVATPVVGMSEVAVAISVGTIEEVIAENQAAMDRLIAKYRGVLDLEPVVRNGDPQTVILDAVGLVGADLLVIGTHGRTGLKRLLLGSVAEQVIRHAKCPVLTVHADDVRAAA